MSLKSGTWKSTVDRILGRPAAYRVIALALALTAASSVAISAATVQEPAPAKTCSCGCPYCCGNAPAEGVGSVEVNATAPVSDALDYTNNVIWGWDGRYCDLWEMDLFARMMYLEFWGTSQECCEAGVDSVLRLLESGYFGDSLGRLLSAKCDTGAYVYSPYAYVWDWTYDEQGLTDMYNLCMERFSKGPQYEAPFFQLWYYPAWATPCYNIGNVYFSTFKK